MEGLVEAAKKEGELNVIALPPDWANYGAIIKAFSDKYGIAVNPAQPDANSQDEINTANQQKGKSTAPDVFDLGQSVALANTSMFAPYKVATFDDISESFKDPDGKWVNDYGGFMSIGYDSSRVPDIASINDLMKPEFKGKVALNGDPTQAGSGFSGVMMVAISQGGSPDDVAPGVEFFRKLNEAGNFLPVDPTPATVESGETPVVHRLGLPQRRRDQEAAGVARGHPAECRGRRATTTRPSTPMRRIRPPRGCGRSSCTATRGRTSSCGVVPGRCARTRWWSQGTIDLEAYRLLPPVDGGATFVSEAQNQEAKKYLEANWAKAVG